MFFSSFFDLLIGHTEYQVDLQRRTLILQILLLGYSTVGGLLMLFSVLVSLVYKSHIDLVAFVFLSGITISFVSLYVLSRQGFHRTAATGFLILTSLPVYWLTFNWGFRVPYAMVLFSITVIMAAIVLSTRAAVLVTFLASIYLMGLTFLQKNGLIIFDNQWLLKPPTVFDGLTTSALLSFITLVTWLYNREIENSLHRALTSEAELKKERDSLELKVQERTYQLKQAQMTQIMQYYQFAEVGKLSASLFHDLINHLTAASLNLEQITGETVDMPALKRTRESLKHMEDFLVATRKQIQKQDFSTPFFILPEIQQAIALLEHSAHKKNITVQIEVDQALQLTGNPIKFSKIITNILKNAIDSYSTLTSYTKKNNRLIVIEAQHNKNEVILIITDNGSGIPKRHQAHIFEPLFTTKKPNEGTGIGLTVTRDLIIQDFKGSITFTSTEKVGTVFTLTFPLASKKNIPSKKRSAKIKKN